MADNHPMLTLMLLALAPLDRPGLQFIDVGQGSALLIRDDVGEVVLIDSGPASGAEPILAALAAHEVGSVALWIHTHHDADHVGGFARVVAGLDGIWPSADDVEVEQLWDRGLAPPIPDTDASALYFELAGERRSAPDPGRVYASAGLRIEVLELDPAPAEAGENARGLALCVELDGLRALIPGDLPADRLALAAAACGPVDVLWASHHGSASASSVEAIALADPWLTVISAGHDNPYCHPASSTLALFHDRRVRALDAAGLDPDGACSGIAAALGPDHTLIGADLWLTGTREVWLGSPSLAWVPDSSPL